MLHLLAGATRAYAADIAGHPVLVSAAEAAQLALFAERRAGRVPFLMLDNGAFRAWNGGEPAPSLERYVGTVLANLDGLDVAIALDVIPGRKGEAPTAAEVAQAFDATLANAEAMLAAGVPADKLAGVVHLRMARWREALDAYLAMGLTWICLGGCVGADDAEAAAWVAEVMAHAAPEALGGAVRYHLLGVTKAWAHGVPAYSCDSTTWLYLAKGGSSEAGRARALEQNRYLLQNLPGWFYHQHPRAARLAGDATDGGADLTVNAMRKLGAAAMQARIAKGSGAYLPEADSPARDMAVTWLRWEAAGAAGDEVSDEDLAALALEAEADARAARVPVRRQAAPTRAAAYTFAADVAIARYEAAAAAAAPGAQLAIIFA